MYGLLGKETILFSVVSRVQFLVVMRRLLESMLLCCLFLWLTNLLGSTPTDICKHNLYHCMWLCMNRAALSGLSLHPFLQHGNICLSMKTVALARRVTLGVMRHWRVTCMSAELNFQRYEDKTKKQRTWNLFAHDNCYYICHICRGGMHWHAWDMW